MPHNAFLITGANAGLGKDVARQLALRSDVDSIYLACRDQAKAEAAQADLQRITGRSVFEVLIMDTADVARSARHSTHLSSRCGRSCSTPAAPAAPRPWLAPPKGRQRSLRPTCSVTRFCWKAYSMRGC